MKLRWTRNAKVRREEIFDYISSDNPQAALQLDMKIEKAVGQIAAFPRIGHKGRIDGTYELIVEKKYIIIYQISVDYIEILTIHHTAQQYPPE